MDPKKIIAIITLLVLVNVTEIKKDFWEQLVSIDIISKTLPAK